MVVSGRYFLALLLTVAPAIIVGFWPAPGPALAGHQSGEHGDHSPAAVEHVIRTRIPPGVGAEAWDGHLPEWTGSGRTVEVGAAGNLPAALAAARDGDRIVVTGGRHRGNFRISSRIWLEGKNGAALERGAGTVVTVTAAGARVTGLRIEHSGDSLDDEDAGVLLKDAEGAIVAECHIRDVKFGVVVKNSPVALVAGNTVTGREGDISLVGDGIRVWHSDRTRVLANTVRHTREILVESTVGAELRANAVVDGRQGLHLMWAKQLNATGNFVSGNSTGIYVMYGDGTQLVGNWVQDNRGPSGYGIGLKEADAITAMGNWLVGNRVGLYFDNSPLRAERPNRLIDNFIAFNDLGAALNPSTHDNEIDGNDFVDNMQQVSIYGDGSLGDNRWGFQRGNYWSDYAGYDSTGDGQGDVTHAPARLFEGWMDRRPALRWFWFTPAATAVEVGSRAFPLAAPEPIFTEARPAMTPDKRRDPPWSSLSK